MIINYILPGELVEEVAVEVEMVTVAERNIPTDVVLSTLVIKCTWLFNTY